MGKRSDFERRERDFYPTPYEAALPLFNHLNWYSFCEPCCGDGALITHLQFGGLVCWYAYDINQGKDALTLTEEDIAGVEGIITNPPWSRDILHPMIEHFVSLRPTWLLIDADWMHTKQSSDYMKKCSKVVSIGRVKWIPDSKMTGKDNCCWYLFEENTKETIFIGR